MFFFPFLVLYIEEILGAGASMWFSPDGNWLAVASFDDTNVEEFSYILYGEAGDIEYQYEREVHLRYPKVCIWCYIYYHNLIYLYMYNII